MKWQNILKNVSKEEMLRALYKKWVNDDLQGMFEYRFENYANEDIHGSEWYKEVSDAVDKLSGYDIISNARHIKFQLEVLENSPMHPMEYLDYPWNVDGDEQDIEEAYNELDLHYKGE